MKKQEILEKKKELDEQLLILEEVEKQAERKRNEDTNRMYLKHRDVLVQFLRHRGSCNDYNLQNAFNDKYGVPYCKRCALLDMDEYSLRDYNFFGLGI